MYTKQPFHHDTGRKEKDTVSASILTSGLNKVYGVDSL